MCTLILLDRVVPGIPVLVAANRDEFLARPAAPPAVLRPGGRPPIAAPRDLEAGGTWMGVNAAGVFAGLTNRPAERRDERRRSRGLLVMDALGSENAAGVGERLGGDLHRRYNPFFLLAADGRHSSLLRVDGSRETSRTLAPGVHVVGNLDEDDPGAGKVARVRRAVEKLDPGAPFERLFAGLVEVLASHSVASDPLQNTCVHTPDYATRSSAILALGERTRGYWASEGPPCEAEFRDYTRLLDELPRAQNEGKR